MTEPNVGLSGLKVADLGVGMAAALVATAVALALGLGLDLEAEVPTNLLFFSPLPLHLFEAIAVPQQLEVLPCREQRNQHQE